MGRKVDFTNASKTFLKMSLSMNDRMQKLKELHKKRQEARMLNQAQVVEEDRRNKEPKNMEARKRAQYILEEEKQRAECEAQGKDFDREKLKEVGAEDAEIVERRKRAKMDPDKGFSTYENAAFRKYNQQVKSIRPDMEKYAESK